ncbi:Nucleoside transporter FUN26 [Golovinomyces cichoracearum]|uniref:Nucleoside transporter FUN26 n=1 Tax=Golovinomyces cichoracearum TaxID=62708 RepID=A0A420IXH5_9PEZI|nr:Nucleoside transporter FUN26 [Golovinomyces cichoracearum]
MKKESISTLNSLHAVNTEIEDNGKDTHPPVVTEPENADAESYPFSWIDYSIFMLLGVSMLWAWNMFLAAAPYFKSRFAGNKTILMNFQAGITSVSCITGFFSMLILTRMQAKANYPKRILIGLALCLVVFVLLSISTLQFRGVSETLYFIFTLIMVFVAALSTSFSQNGAFAFAAGIGRPEYIQAMLTGQAIAGVLPSMAQIISVYSVAKRDKSATSTELLDASLDENTSAALKYFITATVICVMTSVAIIPIIRRYKPKIEPQITNSSTNITKEPESSVRPVIPMRTLFKKLRWLAAAVFLCLAITMFFPVFTERIVSIIPEEDAPTILRSAIFIPMAFLIWNIGDLIGRLLSLVPCKRFSLKPVTLFILVSLRAVYVPLYFLCNIGGGGATVKSDAFYLIFVSAGFGFTNGLLSSLCLIKAGEYVLEEEREASGGFMIVNLQAGLMVGSLLSFVFSGAG